MTTTTKIINTGLLIAMLLDTARADVSNGNGRFGDQPLNDVIAAALAHPKCPGLTSAELAVMMLVPVWWETVNGSSTDTPSPMELGRSDYGLLRPDNKRLYSFVTYAKEERAFAHGGIGLWQLDDAGPLGKPWAAFQRINTQSASEVAAGHMAVNYCKTQGTAVDKRRKAWSDWNACKGTKFQRCDDTYTKHYNPGGTGSIRYVVRDPTVSRTGGMVKRKCRYSGQTSSFTCYYIDPSKAKPANQWWATVAPLTGGPTTGTKNGSTPSPLAFPFYNYLRTPTETTVATEYRHWIVADTAYTRGEIHARRRDGTGSREDNDYNGWIGKNWLCDDTLDRGTCVP
jgi:hypothetical protein